MQCKAKARKAIRKVLKKLKTTMVTLQGVSTFLQT